MSAVEPGLPEVGTLIMHGGGLGVVLAVHDYRGKGIVLDGEPCPYLVDAYMAWGPRQLPVLTHREYRAASVDDVRRVHRSQVEHLRDFRAAVIPEGVLS